jgi:hypothetical protein
MRVAATGAGLPMLVAGGVVALVAPLVMYIAFRLAGESDQVLTVALVGVAVLLAETAGVLICAGLDSLQVAPGYSGVFETAVFIFGALELLTGLTLVFVYSRAILRRQRQ